MAEQCDFDALAALLDNDSGDEMKTENEPTETKAEDSTAMKEKAESSDSDIDEDELDILAGLAEEDCFTELEAKDEHKTEKRKVKMKDICGMANSSEHKTEEREVKMKDICGMADSSDDDIDEDELDRIAGLAEAEDQRKSKEIEAEVPMRQEAKDDANEENPHETQKEEEDDEEESEDEQKDTQDKLKQMYAMIAQMESEIKNKSKKKKKSGAEKSKKEPTEKSEEKKMTTQSATMSKQPPSKPVKPSSSTQSTPSGKDNESVSAKLQLIQEDIFSQATNDPKPSGSGGPQTSSGKDKAKEKPEEPVAEKKLYTVKEAQEQLFGSDSDSDWEGLDGEKASQYNQSGQEIQQIIKKKETQRVAHSAAFDISQISNRKPSWGKKDVYKPRSVEEGSSSGYTRSVSPPRSRPLRFIEEDDKDVLRDSFSELRIVNPRISSTQLKLRMEGRQMFQLSSLHRRVNTADMEKDWVTIGVLIQKSEPKMSSTGKQYSIWTLSDLKDCQKAVKMFLFGDVHNQHWKMSIGSVVGFLNPNPMTNNEKFQNKSDEVTLCVDNANKVMHMGQSKDFGFCKSFTKAGRKCTNFINKNKAEFCEYHVSQAYRSASAKRGDLQGGTGGMTPKNQKPDFKQKVLGGTGQAVFYAGQTYCAENKKQTKKGVSLNTLQSHEKTKGPLKKGHVTTLSLYDIKPEDAVKLEKFEEKKKLQDQKAFHEMLASPTIGSMNLVKHLMGSKQKDETKQLSFHSVTAQDMFKNLAKPVKKGFGALDGQSDGVSTTVRLGVSSPAPSTSTPLPKSLPKMNLPQLGRGFGRGENIFLASPTKKSPLPSKADHAKRKAVELAKKKGGIQAADPNSVKKKMDKEKQHKIKKRLCDDSDRENDKDAENVQAKKKPRLTGGVDLDDPEIQKLLKKKSKHDNLLLEVEQEKQDEYFDVLEKKEKMEQKMGEITKVKVKAVSCKKCGYTSYKAADICKQERHELFTHEATKRFFVCKHCKSRTTALDRLPKSNCNCGKNSWVRTCMLREKKGPKLESEELILRGDESKFLNSLQ